jgi:molecular chaperone DnaK (HSP70)
VLTTGRDRFSIGIDLGTTNSALAFVPLADEAAPEIMLIPQWESLAGLAEQPTLPSFLYLPEDAVAAHFRNRAAGDGPLGAREGRRNARAGRSFREVLALPSRRRSVGAVPAMGNVGSDA